MRKYFNVEKKKWKKWSLGVPFAKKVVGLIIKKLQQHK